MWGLPGLHAPRNGIHRADRDARAGSRRIRPAGGLSYSSTTGSPTLDRPFRLDGAVERHRPAELPHDPAEHARVLLLRIRVVGGHHAARPQLGHGDHHRADPEPPARPLALAQPVDAAHHDVRAQPPPVDPERRDRAVRRDQKREDVEPLLPQRSGWSRAPGPAACDDQGRHLRRRPRLAIDARLAVGPETAPMPEQPRARPRGDHAAPRVVHLDQPVADDSVAPDLRALEPLTRPATSPDTARARRRASRGSRPPAVPAHRRACAQGDGPLAARPGPSRADAAGRSSRSHHDSRRAARKRRSEVASSAGSAAAVAVRMIRGVST